MTLAIARLAINTGLFPLYEVENGQLARVRKIAKKLPVEEYLKPQGRFRHLFEGEGRKEEIAQIQKVADENIRKYGLITE